MLAFGDGAAFFVHPGQRVVAVGGADINHDTGGRIRVSTPTPAGFVRGTARGGQRLGGKNDVRQVGNGLLQRRIGVAGVFPDLVGQRREIHFVVLRVVQDAGFLREQVANDIVVFFVLEKGFVRADDFGVFVQALADARAQADEALDAIGGQERSSRGFVRLSGRYGPRGPRAE